MSQVAMRAPGRGYSSATVEGQFNYKVDSYGVALVHGAHVKAMRMLGFTLCTEESPDAPSVASLSEDDWKAYQAFKREQAEKAKAEAEAPAVPVAAAAAPAPAPSQPAPAAKTK